MFSKSRINEPGPKADTAPAADKPVDMTPSFMRPASNTEVAGKMTKSKPAASVLASDLIVTGNLRTTGDVVVEGTVDGDIRAHLLTVGETATIRGEIVADDIVINGRVIGRVRGLKVRLTSSAQVEGDIIHKTIAIESGAHFEGSVQRQDDPLQSNRAGAQAATKPQQQPPAQPQPQPQVSDAVRQAAENKKNAAAGGK